MSDQLTVGDVARRLGVPRVRVNYAIDKAGIRERGRAGILRLFSLDQLPVIRAALQTVRTRTTVTLHGESKNDSRKEHCHES
jgi:hypothetical protein